MRVSLVGVLVRRHGRVWLRAQCLMVTRFHQIADSPLYVRMDGTFLLEIIDQYFVRGYSWNWFWKMPYSYKPISKKYWKLSQNWWTVRAEHITEKSPQAFFSLTFFTKDIDRSATANQLRGYAIKWVGPKRMRLLAHAEWSISRQRCIGETNFQGLFFSEFHSQFYGNFHHLINFKLNSRHEFVLIIDFQLAAYLQINSAFFTKDGKITYQLQ